MEKDNKKIAKRALIFVIIVCVIFVGLYAKHYKDEQEKENGNIIKSTVLEEEETDATIVEEADASDELLDKFAYTYDESNYFTLAITEDKNTNKTSVHAFCHYSEDNMGLMQNDFMFIWMYPYVEAIDVSIMANVGEKSYMYLVNDASLLMNTVPLEPLEEIPENYIEAFSEMREELIKFYEKNGILVQNEQETEFIGLFEKAEYDKFNSYASENGLGDTLICIEGEVLNQTKIGDSDSEIPILALVVEQEDGNRWSVSVPSNSEIEEIEEKNVRIFGTYLGFSDVANLPAMIVYVEDINNCGEARIEIEKDGEYVTVWKFSDYVKEELNSQGEDLTYFRNDCRNIIL